MRGRLTAAIVRSLAEPGMYGDGGTLYLRIAPGGSKSWVQRIAIHGKRHDLGLGGYPLVTLAEAREAAFDNRRLARRGGDPLAEKRRAKVPTFCEALEATINAHRKRWRNPVTERNWRQSMAHHALATIGNAPVNRIGGEDVLRILTPLWTKKPEAARKLRQRIRAVLKWAQAHGFVDFNAAGERIDGALPRMPAIQSHFRALPYPQIPAALDAIDASGASPASKLCFRFTVLTAARSGEARRASWSEMDPTACMWRIPSERMKNGAEHRVPLSAGALEVLDRAKALGGSCDLVFPSPIKARAPLSNMAMTKLLRHVGLADRATVHGFRSGFRDWCADNGQPRELAEAALAHTVRGVEGAYFRSDVFDRRRRLMDEWGRFLAGKQAGRERMHGQG